MLPFLKSKKLAHPLIFDAEYYRTRVNPPLADKPDKYLRKHFISEGLPGGQAGSPVFHASYYLDNNEDVKAIADDDYTKAVEHFLTKGIFENRRTSPHFDVSFYYNSNKDLQQNIGRDYPALYNHFLLHGRHEDRISNPNAIPDSFMIELTNACNLRCITCPREYKYGHEMDVGQMDYEKLKRLLDQVMPLANSINLTGLGETLLYKKLPEIINIIQDYPKNIGTFLSTNAQTPNCLDVFENITNKVNIVQISIDGVNATYDQVRDKASFTALSKNLKKMSKMADGTNTSLMFNVVAFPANYKTLPDIVTFANEVGVGHVNINSRNLAAIPEVSIEEYEFYKTDEFRGVVETTRERAEKFKMGFSIFENNGFCELVYNHFYITWDGFLVPCCAKPFPKELNFGNVFDESLITCIKNYQTSRFRSDWDICAAPSFCERCHIIY